MSKLKYAFFGGEPLSIPVLEQLKANSLSPDLIVCNPDKPKGRNLEITPPPTKVWAEKNNVPYVQNIDEIKDIYEFFVVVSYGKIIPEKILNLAKLGAINLHPSLLPRYRGPSPIVSTILNGDTETGITIIKIDGEMDHGPILAQEKISLNGDETMSNLEKTLADLGAKMMIKIIPEFREGKVRLTEQNHSQATLCKKIKKEDGLVNLEKESPQTLYNKFRAYATWPRIFFFKNEKRIIITDASLENGRFVVKKIIPENGKEIAY